MYADLHSYIELFLGGWCIVVGLGKVDCFGVKVWCMVDLVLWVGAW